MIYGALSFAIICRRRSETEAASWNTL